MTTHTVVDHEEWIKARTALLAKEKELNKLRDELAQARRDLPWEKVEQDYVFDGPNGKESLADLFDGRSQLIVYHFMFGSDWEEGCKSCSFMADHFNPAIVHLNQRDVTMVAISNGPLDKIQAFQKRMGWTFKWLSLLGTSFNSDYQVSFTEDKLKGEITYNYKQQTSSMDELPGLSVFYRDGDDTVYHTYSTYARGLDPMLTAYHYLDFVPKGRDESELSFSMAWIDFHDSYYG